MLTMTILMKMKRRRRNLDAKRKIFEKEAKKEIQQEFVDKIGFHIDYIKQGKWTYTNGNSAS